MKVLQDLHIQAITPLISPAELKKELPLTEQSNRTMIRSREDVVKIFTREDKRFLVVVGPCSIHDLGAALEYAEKLKKLREELLDRLYIVMRVYFEKPRTTVGWKGLINDPHLDDSCDIPTGLKQARKLLLDITEMGLPVASEFLDPIVPQYIDDLVTWVAIGARTTESQTHREMASGLSMPIGYKNSTDGNLAIAINALKSARHSHSFLGIDQHGRTSVVKTKGNPFGHIILRGGNGRPNYDRLSVKEAEKQLIDAKLSPEIIVDCSHDNSGKKYENQEIVLKDVAGQRAEGNNALVGVMIESNINEGSQKLTGDLSKLKKGVSITDECMSFETTERVLKETYEKLSG